MMYKNTWVVVANATKARFFQATSNQTLKEHDSLVFPEARMKAEDLIADKPGRTFDRQGPGRHNLGTEAADLKDEELRQFAKQVGMKLSEIAREQGIETIYLSANPKLMGWLLKEIDPQLLKNVKDKINHDLTTMNVEEIRNYLPYVL